MASRPKPHKDHDHYFLALFSHPNSNVPTGGWHEDVLAHMLFQERAPKYPTEAATQQLQRDARTDAKIIYDDWKQHQLIKSQGKNLTDEGKEYLRSVNTTGTRAIILWETLKANKAASFLFFSVWTLVTAFPIVAITMN